MLSRQLILQMFWLCIKKAETFSYHKCIGIVAMGLSSVVGWFEVYNIIDNGSGINRNVSNSNMFDLF